jgi:PKD repeat protein
MKKILLSVAIAFGAFSSSYAQEAYPCHTDEKTKEFVDALTPQQKTQYIINKEAYELEIQNFIANNPQLLTSSNSNTRAIQYTIPVVFHILHQGGPENISNEQVFNAVQHMNDDYQKLNSSASNVVGAFQSIVADVEIEFKLAKLDNSGNCTNGITRTFTSITEGGSGTDRVTAVQAEHGNWPGDKYINFFIAKDIGGAAGYTFRPSWGFNGMNNGIHVLHNYVGSIGTSGSSGAHTLTHEVGHWLDLPHTWGGTNDPGLASNCSDDDGVGDTPNTIGWSSCTLSGTSCSSLDNVENFMEYSYCSKMFTNGQKARMHAALNSSTADRDNVYSVSNLAATGVSLPDVLCKANFDSDYRVVCQGQAVTFDDISYSGVTSWNWSFQGGSPSSSSSQSPVVTYSAPGLYEVELTVSDGTSTITETKTAYIEVLDDAVALPFIEGFEGVTSLNNSFWIVKNQGNNQKFEITSSAAHSGDQAIKLANFGEASGNIDAILSQPIDLSTITDQTTLSFRYAYRKRSASNEEWLRVYISKDCGENWAQRKTLKGSNLGDQIASSGWTPSSANDWVTVHMTNVTSSYWVDNFLVKFEFEADGGNNFYLDDINIYTGSSSDEPSLSIEENELIQGFNVYPNPADHTANVAFTVNSGQVVNVALVNLMGQSVQTATIQAKKGKNLVMLDTDNIDAGIYIVNVNVGGIQQTKRLIIK